MYKNQLFHSAKLESQQVRVHLQRTYLAISLGTVFNFSIFATLYFQIVVTNERYMPFSIFITLSTIALCGNFLSAVLHEGMMKRASRVQSFVADVIQNIADQNKIQMGNESQNSSSVDIEIETFLTDSEKEIVLKHQIRLIESNLDLPLMPGKYGPASYVVVNLLISGFVFFIATSNVRKIFY